ncbi:hypothetical protein [Streptomyces sp. NPDC005303]|uniref:hypothetical protein n=1 Tax=Streptomyces sp. NPDC005303 TaxID=3155713 RepID=UPI0033B7E892
MAEGDKYIDYDYVEMNRCFNEKHTTPFSGGKNMDEMQAVQGREDTGDAVRFLLGVRELLMHVSHVVGGFARRQGGLVPAGLLEGRRDLVPVRGVQALELGGRLPPTVGGRFEVAQIEVIQLLVRGHGCGGFPVVWQSRWAVGR